MMSLQAQVQCHSSLISLFYAVGLANVARIVHGAAMHRWIRLAVLVLRPPLEGRGVRVLALRYGENILSDVFDLWLRSSYYRFLEFADRLYFASDGCWIPPILDTE